MNRDTLPQHLLNAVNFFETISEETTRHMGTVYTQDAYFKDPFNEVTRLGEIEAIFAHMFTQVNEPRFEVTEVIAQGEQAFLVWDFVFRMKRFDTETLQRVKGSSHLRFSDAGLIQYHRDYWDVAEELYEKIPVLGGLMRLLKRRSRQ